MIRFPYKRVFGCIGAQRSGKDTVAEYLHETRGFTVLAFADQIKEEFGISRDDFESAKLTGQIERLRQELWDFSAGIRKDDPNHFIRGVIEKVEAASESVIVTDIRTMDELLAMCGCSIPAKVYWVHGREGDLDNGMIAGSKLPYTSPTYDTFIATGRLKNIENSKSGLYHFYQQLDQYFFREDVLDLSGKEQDHLRDYLNQFYVSQRGSNQ
jgi:hypothetical protein